MTTILPDKIEAVWKRLHETTAEDVQDLLATFGEQQPAVVGYLLRADEQFEVGDSSFSQLFLGLLAWEVIAGERPALRPVSTEELEAAEDANLQFLEALEEGAEIERQSAVDQMAKNYNQAPLLTAILQMMMAGNEETPELADENLGVHLLHLKTVIDCLDQ